MEVATFDPMHNLDPLVRPADHRERSATESITPTPGKSRRPPRKTYARRGTIKRERIHVEAGNVGARKAWT